MTDTVPSPPPRRRKMLWIIALVLLSPLLLMAVYVDDWSRDLTTNTAHTYDGGKVEPWEYGGVSAEPIADAISTLSERYQSWRLANEKPLPDDSPLPDLISGDVAATHHFVRTTGLMGYQDDVWLVVEETGDGAARLYAESRSRVGKGDLGQNPRNLVELKSNLSAALGD